MNFGRKRMVIKNPMYPPRTTGFLEAELPRINMGPGSLYTVDVILALLLAAVSMPIECLQQPAPDRMTWMMQRVKREYASHAQCFYRYDVSHLQGYTNCDATSIPVRLFMILARSAMLGTSCAWTKQTPTLT